MRTLMTIELDTAAANPMIADGTGLKAMQELIEQLKPECAYFAPMNGKRACFIVFDMQDAAQLPAITEPLFQGPHASVNFAPVMTLEDVQRGLQAVQM